MAFPDLRAASPVWKDIRAPLLVTHLRTDPVIGVAHARRMPAERRLVLEPGALPWVHGAVSDGLRWRRCGGWRRRSSRSVAPANVNGGH